MLRLPGVYRPQDDTDLLVRTVLGEDDPRGARVLDICTGTGRVALAMAEAGAQEVHAVDVSRRAVATARLNSALRRRGVWVRRADLFPDRGDARGARRAGRYDLVVANPPYVPASDPALPTRGPERAWDAGHDGREVLDRICDLVPHRLAPGGRLWLVQSELANPHLTLDRLGARGLFAFIADKVEIPFGPVLRARADWLAEQGLIEPGQEHETLVVIGAWAA